jgi:hypothetical protein
MTNTAKIRILERAYLVGMTIIAISTIYLSWGSDAPLANFGLLVGGMFMGHVLTEVLNEKEEG